MDLYQKIETVLSQQVRPYLMSHNGDVRVVDFDPRCGVLQLELFGACSNCPSAGAETRELLNERLRAAIPEIKAVELVQFTDQELVDLARKLLNHQPLMPSRAVKFCGGCNPKYNRETVALQLEERLGETLVYAQNGKSYDELYVICGCAARCADISRIRAGRVVMIDSAELPQWIGSNGKETENQGE